MIIRRSRTTTVSRSSMEIYGESTISTTNDPFCVVYGTHLTLFCGARVYSTNKRKEKERKDRENWRLIDWEMESFYCIVRTDITVNYCLQLEGRISCIPRLNRQSPKKLFNYQLHTSENLTHPSHSYYFISPKNNPCSRSRSSVPSPRRQYIWAKSRLVDLILVRLTLFFSRICQRITWQCPATRFLQVVLRPLKTLSHNQCALPQEHLKY